MLDNKKRQKIIKKIRFAQRRRGRRSGRFQMYFLAVFGSFPIIVALLLVPYVFASIDILVSAMLVGSVGTIILAAGVEFYIVEASRRCTNPRSPHRKMAAWGKDMKILSCYLSTHLITAFRQSYYELI